MIPRRIPFFASNSLNKAIRSYLHTTKPSEVEKLEKGLTKILNLPNPLVVGQGRIGLRLILESLELKPGAEVIMPGYTFGTLTKVIREAGFVPVPVDINKLSFQMSPPEVAKAITKRTAVILATHLFGEPCDIYGLMEIAKKHNLYLVEDCAQSLGATLNGKLTGTFGHASFSSFDIAKNLQGIRGGVVFSKNKKLMTEIRAKRDKEKLMTSFPVQETIKALFGLLLIQTPIWYLLMYLFSYKKLQKKFVKYYRAGVNKKVSLSLPPAYAAIIRNNLPSLISRLKKRRQIREMYYSLLRDKLIFQTKEKNSLGSVYMIVAQTKLDIFKLRRYLSYRGVDIALADEIADNCIKNKDSNVAQITKNSITLPISESTTINEIKKVAKYISDFITNQSP